MSTTFDVYPGSPDLPSFLEVLERSTKELHRFLESVGIRSRPPLHLRLQRNDDHTHLPFSLRDPFRWDADTYAWFMVGDLPGGTDGYFDDDAARIREVWGGDFDDPKCSRLETLIRECVDVGHYWSFRRSAGQPAIINVAYGLVAGSLAAITGGFVYSIDSAWDWDRLPALPEDFLQFYFRPQLAVEDDFRDWSERCIAHLAAELGDDSGPSRG